MWGAGSEDESKEINRYHGVNYQRRGGSEWSKKLGDKYSMYKRRILRQTNGLIGTPNGKNPGAHTPYKKPFARSIWKRNGFYLRMYVCSKKAARNHCENSTGPTELIHRRKWWKLADLKRKKYFDRHAPTKKGSRMIGRTRGYSTKKKARSLPLFFLVGGDL